MSSAERSVNFNGHFFGRTIQVVRDLSVDEQKYLYQKAAEGKKAFYAHDSAALKKFCIGTGNLSLYLLFQENSTRTKESFLNAAKFHGMRVNDLRVEASSVQKQESITDTVRMLVGYSPCTGFVMRTTFEGTCRWLETAMKAHAQRIGVPEPFFINAGDGRHEHPTQELLDEFTFVEKLGGDYSHIHIALIGDLFHGRTVHSKKDGLGVFKEVEVDLIAPEDIAMPPHYVRQMEAQGFSVRVFSSIEEYLAQKKVARLWYFTRLQIERMGEQVLRNLRRIQDAVTFKKPYMSLLPEDAVFYHPLPRNKTAPVIPSFLDDTPLNGWDLQSTHGYHVRFALLAMLCGAIGDDFTGTSAPKKAEASDFIRDVTTAPTPQASLSKQVQNFGIKPVENGIVIDHIGAGQSVASIWNIIDVIRRTMSLNHVSSHGVFASSTKDRYKGIMSIPGHFIERRAELKKIAAISSGCTINVIKDSRVVQKLRVTRPDHVYNFEEIHCKNPQCISYPEHKENAYADFYREKGDEYVCNYCETPHLVNEIWDF